MKNEFYIGIDIGGTKIAAGLVDSSGKVLARAKEETPQKSPASEVLKTVLDVIDDVLEKAQLNPKYISGIGAGVPGIVDYTHTHVLVTPNIRLAGFPLTQNLRKKFQTRVRINNDVNLGLLGEQWLGAARGKQHVIGIFPGTGIGGGILIDGKLYVGTHGSASEIGHMVLDRNGPKCTCGNYGCFEAIASRWAIERDIRAAIQKKKKTIIKDLMDKKGPIKSKVIRKALKKNDKVMIEIMKNASKAIGEACVSINHIFNPETIVLGGGVIEACGDFVMPIVQKIAERDPFFHKKMKAHIVVSQLGDDAVMLGAVALVRMANIK